MGVCSGHWWVGRGVGSVMVIGGWGEGWGSVMVTGEWGEVTDVLKVSSRCKLRS